MRLFHSHANAVDTFLVLKLGVQQTYARMNPCPFFFSFYLVHRDCPGQDYQRRVYTDNKPTINEMVSEEDRSKQTSPPTGSAASSAKPVRTDDQPPDQDEHEKESPETTRSAEDNHRVSKTMDENDRQESPSRHAQLSSDAKDGSEKSGNNDHDADPAPESPQTAQARSHEGRVMKKDDSIVSCDSQLFEHSLNLSMDIAASVLSQFPISIVPKMDSTAEEASHSTPKLRRPKSAQSHDEEVDDLPVPSDWLDAQGSPSKDVLSTSPGIVPLSDRQVQESNSTEANLRASHTSASHQQTREHCMCEDWG